MEFKFRAEDDRRLSSPMPVGFSTPLLSYGGGGDDNMDTWHQERERIREQIILEEIARRRQLVHEISREIVLLERELADRRAGFLFRDRSGYNRPHHRAQLFEDGLGPMPLRSVSAGNHLHHHHDREQTPPPEIMVLPPKEVVAEKPNNKLIVLAKPDINTSGEKRKAMEQPSSGDNDTHPYGLKTKPNEEWSCALCQVSAPSEKILNQHLKGKKHIAKEEKLRDEKAAKTLTEPSSAPKKARIGPSNSQLKAKVEQEVTETVSEPVNNENASRDLKFEEKPVSAKDEIVQVGKSLAGSDMSGRLGKLKEHKKFKFWCEMCRIGSWTSQVMQDHMNGKKHKDSLAKLAKLEKSNPAAMEMTLVAPEVIDQLKLENPIVHEPDNRTEISSKSTHAPVEVNVPNLGISEQFEKPVIGPKQEELGVVVHNDVPAKACISPGVLFLKMQNPNL